LTAVLGKDEVKIDLARSAILKEIERREAGHKRKRTRKDR
jgi:hypothetical protein